MWASCEEQVERLQGPESDPALSPQSSLFYYHFLEPDEAELAAAQFEIPALPPIAPRKGEVWKSKKRVHGPNLKQLPWKHVVSHNRPKPLPSWWTDPRYRPDARIPEAKPVLTLRSRDDFEDVVRWLIQHDFKKCGVGIYKKLQGLKFTVVRTLSHTTDPKSFWYEETVYEQPSTGQIPREWPL